MTEDASPENLRKFLESDDPALVRMGISLAKGAFYSAYLATSDSKWKDAYDEHVQAAISLHSEWKNNRSAYSHWVPQFTLYSILMSN